MTARPTPGGNKNSGVCGRRVPGWSELNPRPGAPGTMTLDLTSCDHRTRRGETTVDCELLTQKPAPPCQIHFLTDTRGCQGFLRWGTRPPHPDSCSQERSTHRGPGSCTWNVPLSDLNETLSNVPSVCGKMPGNLFLTSLWLRRLNTEMKLGKPERKTPSRTPG